MKKLPLLLVAFMTGLMIFSCSKNDGVSPVDQQDAVTLKSASVNGKYIVVLKDDAAISVANAQSRIEQVKAKAYGLLKKNDISEDVEEVYGTALQGFAVKMAPGQAKKLAEDETVKYLEADQVVTLAPIVVKGKPGSTTPPAQQTPWGITRVGGGINYTGSNVAWIIDTGVDLTHPDLNVDSSKGATFVPRTSTPNDDNGHGSHVAGIIAAKNNTVGVVGVAAGATVVPVKVLDKRGSGAYSVVIAGVDYVAANGKSGDVANMSLGGPISTALDDAVLAAAAKGIKFSLAAGNESTDANNSSPAHVNGSNIYTISAMGEGDVWAYFSNYSNPPVDYCEPGVSILSCYKDGGYATMSGTSMAAPHMAGLLLLGAIHDGGTVTGDPDGTPDTIGVHQ